MRFSNTVVSAYIVCAGSSALAAPVPYNDATDTVQFKRDLETRGRHYAHHRGRSHHGHHRSHSRHSHHYSQSSSPSPVLVQGETTGEDQHIEKRKNVVNYAARFKLPPGPGLPNFPIAPNLPDFHIPRFPLPKKPDNYGKPPSPQKPDAQGGPLSSPKATGSPNTTSPRLSSIFPPGLMQNRPLKRNIQDLEARGRHRGRRGSRGSGRRRHRHNHAQPSPVTHEEVAPTEGEGEVTPEKRSMGMEIDDLD